MARIDAYQFGRIVADGQQQTQDLIVLPNRVVRNWWRQDGHSLVLDDLQDILEELPEQLLIGTGAHGQLHPDHAALDQLQARGITVETCPPPRRCAATASRTPPAPPPPSTSPAEARRPAWQRLGPPGGQTRNLGHRGTPRPGHTPNQRPMRCPWTAPTPIPGPVREPASS
jgi:hypothetical protein